MGARRLPGTSIPPGGLGLAGSAASPTGAGALNGRAAASPSAVVVGKTAGLTPADLEEDGDSGLELVDLEAQETSLVESAAATAQEWTAAAAAAAGAGGGSRRKVLLLSIAGYCLCSSSLLVVNKVAVSYIPAPSLVLASQLLVSVLVVLVARAVWGLDAEPLSVAKVKPYTKVALVFSFCLFTNVKALQYVNVETVIVFRACSPVAVALLEWLTLGRHLPSKRSWLALCGLVVGAVVYVCSDKGLELRGYAWVVVYFLSIVTEMVYVKHIVDQVPMSTWTRVYYNNLLSTPLALVFGLWAGEISVEAVGMLAAASRDPASMGVLALSWVIAVGISYFGFHLRREVSATSFTVIGVLSKFATIFLNVVLWNKHANAIGLMGVLVCIAAGTLYEESKKVKPESS